MTTSATEAARIVAKLILDKSEYNKGLTQAKTDTQNFSKEGTKSTGALGDSFKALTGVSFGMAGGIAFAGMALQKTIQFIKECEQAANESNIVMAKQEAILKATGYAAGVTAKQLSEMAAIESKKTGIDDEAIANAQSMMLTFRNIGQNEFPRAMRAALDLQTTFGSLDSASLQLGKALNDPIKGVTALSKSGVTFSEVQKEQIRGFVETNQLAKAQAIILAEVEKQVGGTAEAMEKASDGTNRLNVAWENYKEILGKDATTLTRQWNDFWANNWENAADAKEAEMEYARAVKISGQNYNWAMQKYGLGIRDEEIIKIQEQIYEMERLTELYLTSGMVWDTTINQWVAGANEQITATDEMIEDITRLGKSMLSMTASFTAAEKEYNETANKLTEERTKLLEERALKVKQGYLETGQVISELDAKIEENSNKAKENADEHALATHRIVLGYLEQQLAIDGLSIEETEFLLAKGVEWGIYSQTAVDEMRKVQDEWSNFVPGDKNATFTVTTNYNEVHGSGYSGSGKVVVGGGGVIGVGGGTPEGFASGGFTVASSMYEVAEGGKPELYSEGNKTYLLTGSQGGMVTPAKSNSQSQQSYPTAKEIGKATGDALAVKLQQLGLV